MEAVKLIYLFVSMISWGYTIIGYMGCAPLGLPMPDWWYTAAAAAAVTLVILIAVLANEIAGRAARNRRRNARRLGVIRYVDNTWMAVREDENEEE